MSKIPIGIFPRNSETVLATFPDYTQPYYLVAKNSYEETWVKKYIDPQFILSYEIGAKHGWHSEQTSYIVLKHSNVLSLLQAKNIQHILITIAKSKERQQWADEHGIKLISPSFDHQVKYENKLWFDSFLASHHLPKPDSFVYRYDRDKYNIPFKGKVVIQKSESLGNGGTYILNDIRDIEPLLDQNILEPDEEYLVRTFITGTTYGIELFISPQTIALSLARIQCFYKHETTPNFVWFNGTQFVPSSTFSQKLKDQLTEKLLSLARHLYDDGYLGYAGIDVIVDSDDNIFILECNPRFTTSSPLLMHYPETMSGLNTSQIFIDAFLRPQSYDKKIKEYSYPESNFAGSILRPLLQPHSENETELITRQHPIGLYTYSDTEITYISPDIRELHTYPNAFIYYGDHKVGESYKPNTYIADIFANFPLYDFSGKLNQTGKKILKHFEI